MNKEIIFICSNCSEEVSTHNITLKCPRCGYVKYYENSEGECGEYDDYVTFGEVL